MLDRHIRPVIDRPLDALARRLAAWGIGANQVTLSAFLVGLWAMAAIATGQWLVGLVLILVSRALDGLDGAVARAAGTPTTLGSFLDIVLDFLFYSGAVLAFAVADPATNALAAAFLIFSFVGTGSSFLAFATLAAKLGLPPDAGQGQKGIHYLSGLTEGTETIAALLAFCLFPQHFPLLATVFAGLCLITTATRIAQGIRAFGPPSPPPTS